MDTTASAHRVMELTDATFGREVAEGVVLVDFWAPWCGPCRMQAPILEQVANRVAGAAKVAKVNVDECVAVASRFGIRSIPTMVLLQDGRPLRTWVGVQQAADLTAAVTAATAAMATKTGGK